MKTSNLFQALLRSLEEQMVKVIEAHLDEKARQSKKPGSKRIILFDEQETLMSFYPDNIMLSVRREVTVDGPRYFLRTGPAKGLSIEDRDFEIGDIACIPAPDLIFIIEQLERHG